MITGSHTIILSKNPQADRAFFKEVLHLSHVDAGEGWLIFALPPSEVAIHPHKRNNVHQFYLICDDIEGFMREMAQHGIACDPIVETGWGLLTYLSLPGGGKLGAYEPKHARPTQ